MKTKIEDRRHNQIKGSYLLNQISVCVDKHKDDAIQGRVFHHEVDKVLPFHGVDQLLLRMEHFLDKQNYPVASTVSRTFSNPREETTPTEEEDMMENKNHGEKATFIVQVQYRQNATWQGYVTWVERDIKRPFRSALELIKLMDSSSTFEENDHSPFTAEEA